MSFGSAPGGADLVTFVVEQLGEYASDTFFVVDNQDPGHVFSREG